MPLLPVEDALRRILDGVGPTGAERVSLAESAGRVLAEPLTATRDQPPFDASSMDGFAVRASEAAVGAALRIVGESAAGRRFAGTLGPGEAVVINTGAPMPAGADAILVKENASVADGHVTAERAVEPGKFIRPKGLDFRAGDILLDAGRRLGPREIALAAASGAAALVVRRRPRVAFLSIGDELVAPGEPRGPDQITAASAVGLAAMVQSAGAEARDLGIVPDRAEAVAAAVSAAADSGTDVLVTIGGASVGDHDVVHAALAGVGATRAFWRIAMRPGRPMLFGALGGMRILGLPGNPVSSLVCSLVFLRPLTDTLLGAPAADATETALLGADVGANDDRQDYLRARLAEGDESLPVATPFPRQDSSMLKTLADADCLIIRPPHAPAAKAGQSCRIIRLQRASA